MVPKSHASDMRWRFSQGATDYDTLKSSILTYTQHVRFENSYGKGNTDMQDDAFSYAKSDECSDWLSVDDHLVSEFSLNIFLSSEVAEVCSLPTKPRSRKLSMYLPLLFLCQELLLGATRRGQG